MDVKTIAFVYLGNRAEAPWMPSLFPLTSGYKAALSSPRCYGQGTAERS